MPSAGGEMAAHSKSYPDAPRPPRAIKHARHHTKVDIGPNGIGKDPPLPAASALPGTATEPTRPRVDLRITEQERTPADRPHSIQISAYVVLPSSQPLTGIEQVGRLLETAPQGDLGGGEPCGVPHRRIGTVRKEQLGDLDRALVVVRQAEQGQLSARRSEGERWILGEEGLEALDRATEAKAADITAHGRDHGDHLPPTLVVGVAERGGVMAPLDRIDLGPAGDEEPGDPDRARVGRAVQRAAVFAVAHIRRHAEVEQKLGDVRAVLGRGGEHGGRVAKQIGMPLREPAQDLCVTLHGGGEELLLVVEPRLLGAMGDEEVDQVCRPATAASRTIGRFE